MGLAEGKTKGRKRHIAVDVLGCLMSVVVHAANIYDKRVGYLPVLSSIGLSAPARFDIPPQYPPVYWIPNFFSHPPEVFRKEQPGQYGYFDRWDTAPRAADGDRKSVV